MKRQLLTVSGMLFLVWTASMVYGTEVVLVGHEYEGILQACLEGAGIPYDQMSEEEMVLGGLERARLLILPYHPQISDEAVARIEAFVRRGGKLFVFYTLDPRLGDLLGIRLVQHRPQEYEGQFAEIRFEGRRPEGVPKRVMQRSWNINVVEPTSDSTRVIAVWGDAREKSTGYPAVTLSPNGAYMSHVLLGDDLKGKRAMVMGMVGHFLPGMWETAASNVLARVGRISSRYENLEELTEAVREVKASGGHVGCAARDVKSARRMRRKAEKWFQERKYAEAMEQAWRGQRKAMEAYAEMQPSREGEFRGVWIHSAYGVGEWGWKKSIQVLKKNGFNAVVPNMLRAGLAHYKSAVLPVAEQVKEQGDQIAECLKWGKEYGIEVHVWKVNYNLAGAPKAFIDQLRAEGRTQKTSRGEDIDWLCPSDPENFELERDSMLEVVRKYAVDGIHFDYIRYPHGDACYCEGCRERFQAQTGIHVKHWPEDVITGEVFEDFQQWRQDQITRLVRAVSEEARRIRPSIRISAAVFRNWSSDRRTVGQDWKRWIEEGLLDFVCPMDYTTSPEQFEEWVSQQVDWVDGRIPLYPGIGVFRMAGFDEVIHQVELARTLGADGFTLFQYDARTGTEVLPALHRGVSRRATVAPHNAPEVMFELPPGQPELEGLVYPEGMEVVGTVAVRTIGRVRAVRGAAEARTVDDRMVQSFGTVDGRRNPILEVRFSPQAGAYRWVVSGIADMEGAGKRPFVARSRVMRVLSEEQLSEQLARYGIPEVEGEGVRVGVFAEGYGSSTILEALKQVDGLLPFPIYTFKPQVLDVCQVLVLLQPKDVSVLDRTARTAIRDNQRFVSPGTRFCS